MPKRKYHRLGIASVGLEMGLAMAIGVLGGRYLDALLDTEPLFLGLGFALGLGAAIKALVDAGKRVRRELEDDESSPPDED